MLNSFRLLMIFITFNSCIVCLYDEYWNMYRLNSDFITVWKLTSSPWEIFILFWYVLPCVLYFSLTALHSRLFTVTMESWELCTYRRRVDRHMTGGCNPSDYVSDIVNDILCANQSYMTDYTCLPGTGSYQ